ncbi:MAG TPA: hypothetical protein VE127_09890 [Solirubrobacteraceae bacterium]|nr:hypothetical protein [Solirubrobacteraceae bacterium]
MLVLSEHTVHRHVANILATLHANLRVAPAVRCTHRPRRRRRRRRHEVARCGLRVGVAAQVAAKRGALLAAAGPW